MPSKDRRIATRQGELSRRKRRSARGPSGIPGAATPDSAVPAASANGAVATATREAPASAAMSRQTVAPSFCAGSGIRMRSFDRTLAYQFIGPELIRIAIFGGAAFAVIIALGFVW